MRLNCNHLLVLGAIVILSATAAITASSIGVAQDGPAWPPTGTSTGSIEGSVAQTIDVPGYTYVEVETADGRFWVATPSVSLRQGDTVEFATGMPMHDFYSKTLRREFRVLYFVDRFISGGGIRPVDTEAAAAHGGFGQQPTVAPVKDIRRAQNGYTIAEIYSRADELRGERVRVRGQIVKFTAGVLNSNWIRIRDGSSAEDLVVPTNATAAINDVVLIEGRLELNKDLGQTYVIPVILEDANITIE